MTTGLTNFMKNNQTAEIHKEPEVTQTRKMWNGLLQNIQSLLNTAEDGRSLSRMWYSISPQYFMTGCAASTIIRHGTIPAGPVHFTNPVPALPEGWVEHTHPEGKLYYVQDAPNTVQGAPLNITIVTDSDPRDNRNLRGLESVHRQVVEAIQEQSMRLPTKVQLFIEIYPVQDNWCDFGGYYLADLDNQSIFWYVSPIIRCFPSHPLSLGWRMSIHKIWAWMKSLTLAFSESST
jgi:hypothetical protein